MRTHWLMTAALLGAVACVPKTQLQPPPGARTLAGDESAAVTEGSGVRLVADGHAWRGHPSDLERRLTVVLVRVENHSGRPLRLRYEDFSLEGGSRFHYAAIPPLMLHDSAVARADTRDDAGTGGSGGVAVGVGVGVRASYAYAPPVRGAWWPYGPWGGAWGWYSPYYGYGPYYPYYGPYYSCTEPLPTRDMLNTALPEGTLEDGGTMTGFLYFQGVVKREEAVNLQARMVDANSGETFGTLSIPFQVKQ